LIFVIELWNEQNYLAMQQVTAYSILSLRKTFL